MVINYFRITFKRNPHAGMKILEKYCVLFPSFKIIEPLWKQQLLKQCEDRNRLPRETVHAPSLEVFKVQGTEQPGLVQSVPVHARDLERDDLPAQVILGFYDDLGLVNSASGNMPVASCLWGGSKGMCCLHMWAAELAAPMIILMPEWLLLLYFLHI